MPRSLQDFLKQSKVLPLVVFIGLLPRAMPIPVATTTVEPWHYPCSGTSTADVIDDQRPPPATGTQNDLKDIYLDVIHMSKSSARKVRDLIKKYVKLFGKRYVHQLKDIKTLTGLLNVKEINPEYLNKLEINSHVQEVFERHARVGVFLEQAIRDEYSRHSGIFRYDLKDIESNHLYPLLCKLKEIMAALNTGLDRRVRRSVMEMPLRTLGGIHNTRTRDFLVLSYLEELLTTVNTAEFEALLVKEDFLRGESTTSL